MGKRDDEYRLEDMIEYDEAYVTKATSSKKKKSKIGRGTQQIAIFAEMAESTVLENFTNGELNKRYRYFNMNKIGNLKAKTAKKLIKGLIDPNAMLQTDDSTKFGRFLGRLCEGISSSKEGKFSLKWAHTAVSNLKSSFIKYKMVSEKKLQNYLEDFCYKVDGRYFGEQLFNRLIIASF